MNEMMEITMHIDLKLEYSSSVKIPFTTASRTDPPPTFFFTVRYSKKASPAAGTPNGMVISHKLPIAERTASAAEKTTRPHSTAAPMIKLETLFFLV